MGSPSSKARLLFSASKGNILPGPYVLSFRREGGLSHVHIPALVHPLRSLLASGVVGPDRISVHLAAPAAVPYRRRSRPWRSRGDFSGDHAPLPPAGRPLPDLVGFCHTEQRFLLRDSKARSQSKDPYLGTPRPEQEDLIRRSPPHKQPRLRVPHVWPLLRDVG